jgi:hypothetical protein
MQPPQSILAQLLGEDMQNRGDQGDPLTAMQNLQAPGAMGQLPSMDNSRLIEAMNGARGGQNEDMRNIRDVIESRTRTSDDAARGGPGPRGPVTSAEERNASFFSRWNPLNPLNEALQQQKE